MFISGERALVRAEKPSRAQQIIMMMRHRIRKVLAMVTIMMIKSIIRKGHFQLSEVSVTMQKRK